MAEERANIEVAIRRSGAVRASVRGQRGLRVFAVVLMAVFFVVLMIGLVSGVGMYRSITAAQARASELDMQAGLVASAVHASDAHDALRRGQGPEGDSLVLVDRVGSDVYETRIYQYRGMLVQEYALEGYGYQPQDANELLPAERFGFTVEDGLVTMAIDDRSFDLYIRSAQDGTAADEAPDADAPAAEAAADDVDAAAPAAAGAWGAEPIEDEPALGGRSGGAA